MKRVLILCTGNSCRSQMAESLWNKLGEGEWEAVSAGSKPAGYVHPRAIEAMREIGIDLTAASSKHVALFGEQEFDLVVTVCDHAKDSCPLFSNAVQTFHWPFDDPADFAGTEQEIMRGFRKVRDAISDHIADYLATFRPNHTVIPQAE